MLIYQINLKINKFDNNIIISKIVFLKIGIGKILLFNQQY